MAVFSSGSYLIKCRKNLLELNMFDFDFDVDVKNHQKYIKNTCNPTFPSFSIHVLIRDFCIHYFIYKTKLCIRQNSLGRVYNIIIICYIYNTPTQKYNHLCSTVFRFQKTKSCLIDYAINSQDN